MFDPKIIFRNAGITSAQRETVETSAQTQQSEQNSLGQSNNASTNTNKTSEQMLKPAYVFQFRKNELG